MGTAKIVEIKDKIILNVKLTKNPPPKLDVILIVALPRPPMIKRILFTAAAMGVSKIIFVNSRRVEKSFWQSSALTKETIPEQLLLGLEQGVDTVMPEVFLKPKFKPFIEDELPILSKKTHKYLAHPDKTKNKKPGVIKSPATIIVGPEGGFIDYEVGQFKKQGFELIDLGARILRVETAVTVLLGRCA